MSRTIKNTKSLPQRLAQSAELQASIVGQVEQEFITSLSEAAVSMEDVTIARAIRAGISVNLGETFWGHYTWTLTNSAGRQAVITYYPMKRRYEIVIDGFEEEEAMYGTVSHMREHPMLSVAIAHAASKLR